MRRELKTPKHPLKAAGEKLTGGTLLDFVHEDSGNHEADANSCRVKITHFRSLTIGNAPATKISPRGGLARLLLTNLKEKDLNSMWKMQKISDDRRVVLSIRGRIVGEELFELQRALVSLQTGHRPVELDLRDVKLVDHEVVTFLACLEAGGTELRNCPPYIREWIALEKSRPNSAGPS